MSTSTEPERRTQSTASGWRARARARNALVAYAFLLPYIVAFLVFQLVPTLTGIGLSFTEWELLENKQRFIGIDNFVELTTDSLFWQSFGNSLYFAVMTTIGITLVALAAALALRNIIRGQTLFRILLYAPVILSVSVIGIVWSRVLANNGLVNYYLNQLGIGTISFFGDAKLVMPAISLTTIWWGFGFPMLIFLSGLYSIPTSLYEAAKLDGAGSSALFWRITLPLLRPALLLVLVTQFIGHMQVFGQPYILTQGGPGYASYPVVLYLYQTTWRYYHTGYAAAMALGLAAFMLIVSLLQMRLLGQRVEY